MSEFASEVPHPQLPGLVAESGMPLSDTPERWPVESCERVYDSPFISVRLDVVRGRDQATFHRAVVEHPDVVGVIALDAQERMLLLRQYRHPVSNRLLEAPAGLLDVPGEAPLSAAQRELGEEGHVRAGQWCRLIDAFSSPGFTDEHYQLFLARDLEPVEEAERYVGRHEEADMSIVWAHLGDVVDGVLAGRVTDGLLVMGTLACWAARQGEGYDALRPV